MRRSFIISISVCLNLVLAALLISQHRKGIAVATNPANSLVITNQGKTLVVVRKQYFAWQELESADYAAYIANLRDIGCPAQTIRDIVVADVNQLYTKRVLEEVPTADQQWWRADPDTNFVATINAKMQGLDQERRTLLATLLGADWETAQTVQRPLVALNGAVLGELSPETKSAVQDIIAKSQQRTQIYLDAQKAAGHPPDAAELARMGQQTRTELAQILNAAQLEEFLLRYSESATALRQQLRGIELSPDEFRALFRQADPIEQQIQLVTGDAASRAAQQAAYAKQLVDILKSVLGADRFQAYQMTQDPLYRNAVLAAGQVGASPDAVQKLYNLNKLIADTQNRIRNDPALTDEQKASQLKIVDQQMQQASNDILGIAPATTAATTTSPTPPPPMPVHVHAYSPGETIDQIGAQYGVSPTAILNANPDVNFNGLTRGAAIKIPTSQPQQ